MKTMGHSTLFQAEVISKQLDSLSDSLEKQSIVLEQAGYDEIARATLLEAKKLKEVSASIRGIDWKKEPNPV